MNYILHRVCSERPDNLTGENSEMHRKRPEQGRGCECAQCEADVKLADSSGGRNFLSIEISG